MGWREDDIKATEQLVTVREAVESIWIAIVLAFVLRAFILEAFVIPTGSMAPRLMGQHWQFDCPACGTHYDCGINTRPSEPPPDLAGKVSGEPGVCPNCNYVHHFGSEWAFSGDRVLVLKYLYRFLEPKPWDVIVFKNPQDNDQNYIKRLIGLPGQQIEIVHGDVFYRAGQDFTGDGVIDQADFNDPRARQIPWKILSKSPKTQEAMWNDIFNNDFQPDPELYQANMQEPWVPLWRVQPPGQADGAASIAPVGAAREAALLKAGAWDLTGNGRRVFAFSGSPAPQTLVFAGARDRFYPNYAYNSASRSSEQQKFEDRQEITSDLKLAFMYVPKAPDSQVALHLSSIRDHFRAWVSADGSCRLEHGRLVGRGIQWDEKPWSFNQISPLEVGKAHQLALVHVDRQVTLWVNGEAVFQTTEAQYPADRRVLLNELGLLRSISNLPDGEVEVGDPPRHVPEPKVDIMAGGGPCELWHVQLSRDAFYTAPLRQGGKGWGTQGNPMVLRKYLNNSDLDEFFVMGDNSPFSLDSRLWETQAPTLRAGYRLGTVPRYNLTGKAFFVYWPGGYRLPLPDKLKLPLVPNVGRMRLIR